MKNKMETKPVSFSNDIGKNNPWEISSDQEWKNASYGGGASFESIVSQTLEASSGDMDASNTSIDSDSTVEVDKNSEILTTKYGDTVLMDGASCDDLIMGRRGFGASEKTAEKLKNATLEQRLHAESELAVGRDNMPLTSVMSLDDGSFMFTHCGFLGTMKQDKDGNFFVSSLVDAVDSPRDKNIYTGLKIGEKNDEFDATPLGLTVFRNENAKFVGEDEVYDNVIENLNNGIRGWFESQEAGSNAGDGASEASKKSPEAKNDGRVTFETVNIGDLEIDQDKQTDLTPELISRLEDIDLQKTEIRGSEYIFLPTMSSDFRFALKDNGNGDYEVCSFGEDKDEGWYGVMDGMIRRVASDSPFMDAIRNISTWDEVWDSIHGEGSSEEIYQKINSTKKAKLPLLSAGKNVVDYLSQRNSIENGFHWLLSGKIEEIKKKQSKENKK